MSTARPEEQRAACDRVIRVALEGMRDPWVVRETWRTVRDATTRRDIIVAVTRRVLKVPYAPDAPGGDPIQPVRATLEGVPCDCEDRTAAVCAMLLTCDIAAAAAYVSVPSASIDHMASAARYGAVWVWADATPPGMIGGSLSWPTSY